MKFPHEPIHHSALFMIFCGFSAQLSANLISLLSEFSAFTPEVCTFVFNASFLCVLICVYFGRIFHPVWSSPLLWRGQLVSQQDFICRYVMMATCSCFCVPSRMFGLHGSSLEIINLCRAVVMISDSCKQLLLSVVGWISGDVFSPKYHQSSYCKGGGAKSLIMSLVSGERFILWLSFRMIQVFGEGSCFLRFHTNCCHITVQNKVTEEGHSSLHMHEERFSKHTLIRIQHFKEKKNTLKQEFSSGSPQKVWKYNT